jgi:hypothetical protein
MFHTRPDRPWSLVSLLYNGYRVITEGKAAGRGIDHLSPSSVEVKERVELYLYSSFALMGGYRANFKFYTQKVTLHLK